MIYMGESMLRDLCWHVMIFCIILSPMRRDFDGGYAICVCVDLAAELLFFRVLW